MNGSGPSDPHSRFEDRGELGIGAHGAVRRVFDRELQREVALKFTVEASAQELYQLKSEFRVLRGISHPNIVTLYELLDDSDRCFFTMELLEQACDVVTFIRSNAAVGESLDSQALERFRAAFIGLSSGLEALHANSIQHCDLKPSNALIAADGRPVLLDFGLATRSGNGDQLRASVGTPPYVAPEAYWGESGIESSDRFALGALMLEALTGFPGGIANNRPDIDPTAPRLKASRIVDGVPSEIEEIVARLLARDPTRRPSAREVVTCLQTREMPIQGQPFINRALETRSDAPQTRPIKPSVFVGRTDELAALTNQLSLAKAGAPNVILVGGESGIGKTALILRFLETNPQVIALRAECRPRESVRFNAVDGVIDTLSNLLVKHDIPIELDEPAREALLQVFPVLERVPSLASERPPQRIESNRRSQQLAFGALKTILAAVGKQHALVWWIDDAHGIDHDSIRVLEEILDEHAPRMLVIMSYRLPAGMADSSAFAWMNDFDIAPVRIAVTGLSSNESESLATTLAGDEPNNRIQQLIESAEGSPFVIRELSHNLRQGNGSQHGVDVTSAVRTRLARLDKHARALTEIVALGGSDLAVGELLAAAGHHASEATLYRLQDENFLRPGLAQPIGLEIYHDRIRVALLGLLPGERRSQLHRRIAEVVREREQPDAALLLEHYLAGGDKTEARRWSVLAAQDAERSLAFGRAAAHYKTALALRNRGDADWELRAHYGHALASAGDGAQAGRVLEDAALAAENAGAKTAQTLSLRSDAARELLCAGQVSQGQEALSRMLKIAGLGYPATPTRAFAVTMARRAAMALRGTVWQERDAASVSPQRLAMIDACWAGTIGLNSFDMIRSAAFQSRHTMLALNAGEPTRVARALTAEAVYRAASGGRRDRARAQSLLITVDELAGRLQHPATTAFAHLLGGVTSYFATDWQIARDRLRESHRIFDTLPGSIWEQTMASMYELWGLAWLGDLDGLQACQNLASQSARASDDWLAGVAANSGHANLRWLASDEPTVARNKAAGAIARFPGTSFQSPHYADLLAQTRIDLYQGDVEAAWRRLTETWPRLRGSMLLQLQLLRIELVYLRACTALACVHELHNGSQYPANLPSETKLLASAKRDCARLRRQKMRVSTVLGEFVSQSLSGLITGLPPEDQQTEILRENCELAGLRLHGSLIDMEPSASGTIVNKSALRRTLLPPLDVG
ncbi:MAG: serine/threonine protein kinase [Hyphomicrobiaceae bacterium]|jgi:serine/threonine protein kinase